MSKTVTSSTGFHFSFRQISDGTHFEAISPYIDGIVVDESELFELRFVVASEAIGNSLGTDSPYFPETAFDEDVIWPRWTEPTEEELEQTRQQLLAGIIPVASSCKCGGGCSVAVY